MLTAVPDLMRFPPPSYEVGVNRVRKVRLREFIKLAWGHTVGKVTGTGFEPSVVCYKVWALDHRALVLHHPRDLSIRTRYEAGDQLWRILNASLRPA